MMLACLVLMVMAGAGADSLPTIYAIRTATPPRIDGVIEQLWGQADSGREFTQQYPRTGTPASEPTTAYVLADRNNLYIAFRCLVTGGKSICAKLQGTSDLIALRIDPFEDDIRCYSFQVTAGGEESDSLITDDGRSDSAWDGVWRSAARVYPWGYVVEMVIPFRTLRFPAGKSEWHIDFGRFSVADNEWSFWGHQQPPDFRVSRMGRLQDVPTPSRDLHFEINPSTTVGPIHDWSYYPALLNPTWTLRTDWFPRTASDLHAALDWPSLDVGYADRFGRYGLAAAAQTTWSTSWFQIAPNAGTAASMQRELLTNSEVSLSYRGSYWSPNVDHDLLAGTVLRHGDLTGRANLDIRPYSDTLHVSGTIGADYRGPHASATASYYRADVVNPDNEVLDLGAGPDFFPNGPVEHVTMHVESKLERSSAYASPTDKLTWSPAFSGSAEFRDRSSVHVLIAPEISRYRDTNHVWSLAQLNAETDPTRLVSARFWSSGTLNDSGLQTYDLYPAIMIAPGDRIRFNFHGDFSRSYGIDTPQRYFAQFCGLSCTYVFGAKMAATVSSLVSRIEEENERTSSSGLSFYEDYSWTFLPRGSLSASVSQDFWTEAGQVRASWCESVSAGILLTF